MTDSISPKLAPGQSKFRVEADTFGELQVPADKYYGAQTQRYAPVSSSSAPTCVSVRPAGGRARAGSRAECGGALRSSHSFGGATVDSYNGS